MEVQDVLFGNEHLPIWAVALRTGLLYVALIIATRIMRQRQVGILSGHNYLVAAGIVSLAAVRMVNPKTSIIEGIVIIFIYAIVNAFTSYMDIKFPRKIDRIPIPLILSGRILKKNLDAVHITLDNLMAQLRLKEAHNLSDIQEVWLEPTGKINVLKNPSTSPVTKKQMSLTTSPVLFPEVVIYDGIIQEESLRRAGYNRDWLVQQVQAVYPANKTSDILLAIIETNGSLYLSTGKEVSLSD